MGLIMSSNIIIQNDNEFTVKCISVSVTAAWEVFDVKKINDHVIINDNFVY